ncbi:hypothetical protein BCR33DRAFT_372522 [Rhizoclosmatium globosum]|uniref:At4g15545-like C-terminal domain-containing protein n=1 Tax=Rhizoclosmatium globosum TaxID=329046 RepID=A0A1Y2BZK8_9FUNG|nr:hypothetical protein BCR33DRAFT_372522 [Rhizoclosmatium globosum]|eukprot:ORY40208.1 hypothetical protein BCR33DRAFT_372522 [Rhizoclosmatium globosum]
MSDDFEACLSNLRQAHTKADAELHRLRDQLARKDAEVQELVARLGQTEALLSAAETRAATLERTAQKLAAFKQTVMKSLHEDESIDEIMSQITSPSILTPSSKPSIPTLPVSRNTAGDSDYLYSRAPDVTTRLLQSKAGTTSYLTSDRDSGTYRRSLTNNSITPTVPPASSHQIPLSSSSRSINGVGSSSANVMPIEREPRTVQFASLEKMDDDSNNNYNNNSIRSGTTAANSLNNGISSQQSGSQNSGTGGLGSVDGREFFKLARARLSAEDFSNLLNNVKAYNAREQTRNRTLDNMYSLLGDRNRDLYEQFEQLFSR